MAWGTSAGEHFLASNPPTGTVFDWGGAFYHVKSPLNPNGPAKGDDAANDLPAFNGAVAAANAGGRGGAVYTGTGQFRLADTLAVKANAVHLFGPGYNRDFSDHAIYPNGLTWGKGMATIKPLSSFPSGHDVIAYGDTTSAQFFLEGGVHYLCGTGNSNQEGGAANILGQDVVSSRNVQGFHLERCVLERALGRGYYTTSNLPGGVSNIEMERNLIRNVNGAGSNFDVGIDINFCLSNYFSNTGDYGSILGDVSNFNTGNFYEVIAKITGAYKAGTGIYINAAAAKVTGNHINLADYYGIYDGHAGIGGASIQANLVTDCNGQSNADGAGIYVENSPPNTAISGNIILDDRGGGAKMPNGVRINTGAGATVNVSDNPISGSTGAACLWVTGTGKVTFHHNPGYNPVGVIGSPPAVAATGVAVTNNTGVDVFLRITTGVGCTISAIAIGGTVITGLTLAASLTSGEIRLPANQTITVTYAGGTFTWQWIGD